MAPPREGRSWPFLPLPLGVVALVALFVALAVGALGLNHLQRTSDSVARDRSRFLAETLAARLTATDAKDHEEALGVAARRIDEADLVLLDEQGHARINLAHQTFPAPDLQRWLEQGSGVADTALGRSQYWVSHTPISSAPGQRVMVLVRAPSPPVGTQALVGSLLALTVLLVLVAGAATYSVAFDALRDVTYVTRRIQEMARVATEPAGEQVATRTMDEVGFLTLAYNELHASFTQAEARYRRDLDRARDQDRDRAAFLAAVSHELRTPLHAILGFTEVLESEVDGPLTTDALEDVEQIRASGAHLSKLINDILEFSALEGGQLRLKLERCDLRKIAEEVVREAAPLVGEKPVKLSLEAQRPVYFMGDATRVRQILANLVGNAIKFTKRGEVRVTVWEERGEVQCAVLDTGIGIRPEERALIFEDFKQTKQERGRRRGTGLGLAIARRLVALHGGRLRLASEVGRGSEFRVAFRAAARFSPPTSMPKPGTIRRPTPPAFSPALSPASVAVQDLPGVASSARAMAASRDASSQRGASRIAPPTPSASDRAPLPASAPTPAPASTRAPHGAPPAAASPGAPARPSSTPASTPSPDDTVRADPATFIEADPTERLRAPFPRTLLPSRADDEPKRSGNDDDPRGDKP